MFRVSNSVRIYGIRIPRSEAILWYLRREKICSAMLRVSRGERSVGTCDFFLCLGSYLFIWHLLCATGIAHLISMNLRCEINISKQLQSINRNVANIMPLQDLASEALSTRSKHNRTVFKSW